MIRLPILRTALLASCSGIAITLAAPRAEAANVTVQWSFSVGASPTTGSNTVSDPNFVDQSPSGNGTDGSSVFGHHYGVADGTFGTRSSGNGNFVKSGSSLWSDTFTNNGSAPIALTGSFLIDNGQLSMFMPEAAGSYLANISAQIEVDNVLVFSSFAQMAMSNGGTPTFTTTGTVLNPGGESLSPGSGNYSWGSYLGTVDLGTLAPGQSVTVEYLLASYATGVLTDCGDGGYGSYGDYGGYANTLQSGNAGYGGSCFDGYAEARIGDPFQVPQGANQFAVTAAPVETPEPASMAVLGAGLAALAFRKRRRTA